MEVKPWLYGDQLPITKPNGIMLQGETDAILSALAAFSSSDTLTCYQGFNCCYVMPNTDSLWDYMLSQHVATITGWHSASYTTIGWKGRTAAA